MRIPAHSTARRYYTRWSWPDGQTPKIFVKDLHKTDACEVQKEWPGWCSGALQGCELPVPQETKPEKSVPKMTVWRNHNEHAEHEHAEHGRMIRGPGMACMACMAWKGLLWN